MWFNEIKIILSQKKKKRIGLQDKFQKKIRVFYIFCFFFSLIGVSNIFAYISEKKNKRKKKLC